jgi:hypothetical protein
MKNVSNSLLALLFAVFLLSSNSFAFQRISLGSTNFTIEPSATTMAYSQTSSDLILNGTYGLGDTFGGLFDTPYDWSLVSDSISLLMSINGPNPSLPLTVDLYDSTLSVIAAYAATTFGVTSTPSTVPLTLVSPGTMNFGNVAGFQYTWDAAGSIDANVALQVAPEPSTYALLLAGGIIGAAHLLRRRQ